MQSFIISNMFSKWQYFWGFKLVRSSYYWFTPCYKYKFVCFTSCKICSKFSIPIPLFTSWILMFSRNTEFNILANSGKGKFYIGWLLKWSPKLLTFTSIYTICFEIFLFISIQFFGRYLGLDLYSSSYQYASQNDDQLMIFNTNSLPFDGAFTENDKKISRTLLQLWTNFVKNGHNPSLPNFKWIPLNEKHVKLDIDTRGLSMVTINYNLLKFWYTNIWPEFPPKMYSQNIFNWKLDKVVDINKDELWNKNYFQVSIFQGWQIIFMYFWHFGHSWFVNIVELTKIQSRTDCPSEAFKIQKSLPRYYDIISFLSPFNSIIHIYFHFCQ